MVIMKFFFIYFTAAFLFFISSVSFAKDGINIVMLHPDLSFSIKIKHKTSDDYYLQILYTERSKSDVLDNIKLIQKSIQYPMAMQPYREGYRVYVGPLKGSNISSVRKLLLSIGYDEFLLRHINNKSDFFIPEAILFKKTGRIEDNDIIIPFNENGSLARFSSLDIDTICQSINVNSTVALFSQYRGILSSLSFISDIGAQNRFWLGSKKTITRVSDKLVIKDVDDHARYPVICLINKSFS
ncbi:hypothetical protein C0W38_18140 [Photobacterium angustum]|uniref:hypothetical protein n=2 Tax=Photobacterium angustum TaxID=661 RepID=UPI0005DE62CE|nr:hypothetical protein [Photobacterium angustum]KJG23125.1 hypothetical protein UA39_11965 [Photobacterium angustum]KJG30158.1 hypothetical protein UA36_12985 [Photobacterium angustum]PSW96931.1 hypothetical protein C0W79_01385 [Photobacterium angustum]PSX00564.1 hypothetical protein C0W87_17475 [Photobacterium angustum]PSX32766.1 hypothetical protein C0W38_18140 [Photobacterium angustum]